MSFAKGISQAAIDVGMAANRHGEDVRINDLETRIANQRNEINQLRRQLEQKERPEHEVREENQRLKSGLARAKWMLERMAALTPDEVESVLKVLNKHESPNKTLTTAMDKMRLALEHDQRNYWEGAPPVRLSRQLDEAEYELKGPIHGLIQWTIGMCTDEADHWNIEQQLRKLDEMVVDLIETVEP